MVAQAPAPVWPREVPRGSRGTAVVIEDHLILRTTLASLLEGLGYVVRGASNGFSGLRLVREVRPDLVILDVVMPELDGQQVLATMREEPYTAEIPTLVITGYPDGIAAAGERDRLLLKPFAYDEFLRAVEDLAPEGTSTTEALAGTGA